MAHHRDARLHDRACTCHGHRSAALELDGVAAGLLLEPEGGRDGLLVTDLVRAVRQIADHERRLEPAAHGLGEDEELLDRDGDRRVVRSTVIAPESPTSTRSTPATSAARALGKS